MDAFFDVRNGSFAHEILFRVVASHGGFKYPSGEGITKPLAFRPKELFGLIAQPQARGVRP